LKDLWLCCRRSLHYLYYLGGCRYPRRRPLLLHPSLLHLHHRRWNRHLSDSHHRPCDRPSSVPATHVLSRAAAAVLPGCFLVLDPLGPSSYSSSATRRFASVFVVRHNVRRMDYAQMVGRFTNSKADLKLSKTKSSPRRIHEPVV
jgi:hypothetical protein